MPNFLLTVIIWRNRVTDGQLAAKLPVPLLAGVELALLLTWLWWRSRLAGSATALALYVALAQADRGHPVDGWYPVTHWREGEIARDQYLLLMPKGNAPAAMRIAMYRSDPELGFINSPWLSLPIPEK